MHTRREFNRMVATAIPAMAIAPPVLRAAPRMMETTVAGVKLGLITGSLNPTRKRPAPGETPLPPEPLTGDQIINDCYEIPAANVEWGGPAEGKPQLLDGVIGQPPKVLTDAYRTSRAAVREWHLTAPLGQFYAARRAFDSAGVNWFSADNTIAEDCEDDEIEAMFKQMKAMGVKQFTTNQTRMAIAPRLIPFVEKYQLTPTFHTHDKSEDPNEIASAESLVKLINMSPLFMINLDIGHFTAGNQDAPAFIREHHDRITHIHVKDRKRNHGPNVAWGTGDTPIVECLRIIRDNHYPILALIEREYHGPDDGTPVEETRKDMEYMERALLT